MNPQLLNELQCVRELLSNPEQELQQAYDQISILRQQLSESSERQQVLTDRINEGSRANVQLNIMMEEYLRTMRQIIEEQCAERCQRLEERATLMCDKEETSLHLANIKDSFNDVHVKYERCKTAIKTYKINEDLLKQTVGTYEENLNKQFERYEQLKQYTMSQLDKANRVMDNVKKSSQAEIIKLQTILKKSDIQISSLCESLAQKTKHSEDLRAICDELIDNVD